MTPTLIDPRLEAELVREGVVAVPVFEPDEVVALREAVLALQPRDGFAPTPETSRITHHVTFLDANVAYRRVTFDLLVQALQPAVDRYLNRHRILTANIHIKQAGEGTFPVHQNWPVLPVEQTSVTLWCPLVDVDADNGTLEVVPRSHKLVPYVEGPATPAFFDPYRDRMGEYLKALPARAGHGFFFDDNIVHGSSINRSSGPRIAVQIICVPEDSQPIFHVPAGDHFELVRTDPAFFIEQGPQDLVVRQPHWASCGRVENRNRPIDEATFRTLLAARFTPQEPAPAWLEAGSAAPVPPRSGLGERLRRLLHLA